MSETNSVVDSNEVPFKRQRIEDEDESDSLMCSICSENWTAGGVHCLVSLKCGHLFGKSCIIKWLDVQKNKTKTANCPNCKKPAAIKDLRVVLPINISVKDTTEKDELKRELESKKYLIRDHQQNLELSTLSLNLLKKQLQRAKEDYNN